MDIGTSKTTVDEMGGVPHRMIDVTEPDRKYELEQLRRRPRGSTCSAASTRAGYP